MLFLAVCRRKNTSTRGLEGREGGRVSKAGQGGPVGRSSRQTNSKSTRGPLSASLLRLSSPQSSLRHSCAYWLVPIIIRPCVWDPRQFFWTEKRGDD